jgi:hypothetical protein
MLSDPPFWWPGDSLSADRPHTAAFRVLTQHPVPFIAVAHDGAVVFASNAFADVLGCSCDAVTLMSYQDICSLLPPDETLFAVTRLGPDAIERVLRLGRATLFIKMLRSATGSAVAAGPVTRLENLVKRLSRVTQPRSSS